MLRLLSDENFHGRVVRGLLARQPALDLVRAQDVGLGQTPDPAVLAWAAAEGRVLVTHDRQTVPGFAHARVAGGEPMPGVIVVDGSLPIGQAIAELEIAACWGGPDDVRDRVVYLPL